MPDFILDTNLRRLTNPVPTPVPFASPSVETTSSFDDALRDARDRRPLDENRSTTNTQAERSTSDEQRDQATSTTQTGFVSTKPQDKQSEASVATASKPIEKSESSDVDVRADAPEESSDGASVADGNSLALIAQPFIVAARELPQGTDAEQHAANGVVVLDGDSTDRGGVQKLPPTLPGNPEGLKTGVADEIAYQVERSTSTDQHATATLVDADVATAIAQPTTTEAIDGIAVSSETIAATTIATTIVADALATPKKGATTAEKPAVKDSKKAPANVSEVSTQTTLAEPEVTAALDQSTAVVADAVPRSTNSKSNSRDSVVDEASTPDTQQSPTSATPIVDADAVAATQSVDNDSARSLNDRTDGLRPANEATVPRPQSHAIDSPQFAQRQPPRGVAGAGETRGTQRDGLNEIDRTRLVQRVARAFQSLGTDGGELKIRLSPPELGAVKLEVSVRDGTMIARLETETASAKSALLDNLPQLRERLAEQNVKIESFEVDVRDRNAPSDGGEFAERARAQRAQARNRADESHAPVVSAPITRNARTLQDSSRLNIVI